MKFNTEANYVWQPTEMFDISGKELEQLYNTTAKICNENVPTAQTYILIYELLRTAAEILKRNVENDKIKEAPPEKEIEIS